MPPAAAIIGGSIITGVLGSRAAKKSTQAQERGAEAGIAEQRRQFDITTEQLTKAERINRQQLETGRRRATVELRGGRARQFEQLDPFAEAGRGALQEQQSLLGLGTPEDQASARARLTESPGQKFIRERAERSLVRNAAALGGLGGGNVRTALVQQGAGFAAQIESDQFRRLQNLTGAGQTAATNIGQGALSTAGNLANVQFQAGQLTGAGAIGTAARQGQFGQATSGNVANLITQGAQARASGILGQNQAIQQGIGGVLTGAAQGGFFDVPGQFNLPAANVDPSSRTA